MDMFIYGCPRVLRYLSLINETIVIYKLDIILKDINMSFNEFKEISIISGTDYNISLNNRTNLYKTLKYLKQYQLFKLNNNNKKLDFYTWLDIKTDYIKNLYQLYNISNMFLTDNIRLPKLKIKTIEVNMKKIKELMEPEGFIFV